jgi:hypothetical protein
VTAGEAAADVPGDDETGSGALMTLALTPARAEIFRPKGERAEWRLLYEEFRMHGPGEVITYQRLSEVLGRDFRVSRSPLARAVKELENAGRRTLVCVHGTGYRIAVAAGQEELVRARSRRSRRQPGMAAAGARSASRAEPAPGPARPLDSLEVYLAQQAGRLARLDVRDRQWEAEAKALRRDTITDIAAIDDRVTRLADLLGRHGIDTGNVLIPAGPGRAAEGRA